MQNNVLIYKLLPFKGTLFICGYLVYEKQLAM